MLKGIVASLKGNKSGRQGTTHRICRAVVRAAPTVGTCVEIKYIFPGKVLETLDPKRFQGIKLIIAYSVFHGPYIAAFKPHEINIENGGDNMEMLAQGQKAEKSKKYYVMDIIGNNMSTLQGFVGGI